MPLFLIVLIIAVILFAAFLICIYIFTFHSPNGHQTDDFELMKTAQVDAVKDRIIEMISEVRKIPYDEVFIRSDDGLRLRGRYYHTRDGAPLVICFHGYRGNPVRDFSGGTKDYLDFGCNLLVIEQRAHMSSEGHTITYGVKERYDCLRWTEYARDRFGQDCPIVIAGISMGAATVLMASELNLPENVRGIIADAPFTSPDAIIAKVLVDMKFPVPLVMPFIRLVARLFCGFRLMDADASEAVKNAKVPILLIHGDEDHFVPYDMGRQIAEANPSLIRFQTFSGAGHGLSYLVDTPRYKALVREFLEQAFAE